MPDFPQGDIAATIFYDSAEELDEELSARFCASFAVQNEPRIFSQNSSQFITPCEAENLKFISASFWGFGAATSKLQDETVRGSRYSSARVELL